MSKGFLLSEHEQKALYGLKYIAQLLYIFGIRPYMDYATGVVGRKRKVSWQSIAESLYVEPCRGLSKSEYGTPCESKIRRAAKHLEKAGVIKINSTAKQLVFQCLLARRDNQVSFLPDSSNPLKPTPKNTSKPTARKSLESRNPSQLVIPNTTASRQQELQHSRQVKLPYPDTPPVKIKDIDITNVISCRFSEFWAAYPRHEKKKEAGAYWQKKGLDKIADLIIQDVIKRKALHREWLDGYIPHPITYLRGERWNDEIRERTHETSTRATFGGGHKTNSITRSVNAYIRKKQGPH